MFALILSFSVRARFFGILRADLGVKRAGAWRLVAGETGEGMGVVMMTELEVGGGGCKGLSGGVVDEHNDCDDGRYSEDSEEDDERLAT